MSDTNLAPPPPPPPPPPPAPPPAPWHQGVLEGDLLGHAQNKHWDMADPVKFAAAAAKAHYEAEKKLGVSSDKLLKILEPNSSIEEQKAFWTKLGAPAKPEEYDFASVKFKDGTDLDEKTVSKIREVASKNFIPKSQATEMTKAIVELMDNAEAEEKADYEIKLTAEQAKLKDNWGSKFEANKFVAQRGAQLLGVKPEEVQALEKTIGYARVMEMFRSVAERSGEARYVEGDNKPGDVMTKEQATAKLAMLKNDVDWRTKYLNGGAQEKLEFDALTRIMAGA